MHVRGAAQTTPRASRESDRSTAPDARERRIDQAITSPNKPTRELPNTMKSLMIFTKPLVGLQIGQWELTYLLARGMVAFGCCFVLSCVSHLGLPAAAMQHCRMLLIVRSTQPLQAARKQTYGRKRVYWVDTKKHTRKLTK